MEHNRSMPTLSLNNQRLFYVLLLLSVAPIWFSDRLPLVDLPQHAAQVSALRELWVGNPAFTESFHINWFTPYLLGYLVLYALAMVFPVAVAAQLLVSISLAAVPIVTGRLLRAAHADERWKWLAIPCSYGFAFYWGFLSFIVSAPLVLLFLIQTIRFAEAPTTKRGIGIAIFSIFLFFCHVIVLGFASLISLAYLLGRTWPDWKTLSWRALPYTTPIPLIVLWVIAMYDQETAVQADSVVFGPLSYRFLLLLVEPAGRESLNSPFVTVLVTGSILCLPLLVGAKLTRRPERLLPFFAALLVFMCAPHHAMGTAYLYQRMGIFLVPLWLLVWERPAQQRWNLDGVAMLIVTVWALSNAARFASFAKETQDFRVVMDRAEPSKKLAGMIVDNSSPLFVFPVYLHFMAWYQAEKSGIADFNFADFHPQMVRYNDGVGPRIDGTLAWLPAAFEWEKHGGSRYDYFLVKSTFDASQGIFKDKVSSVALVAHSGWWWLYENKRENDSSNSALDRAQQ
jgi:hypothetical protein